MDRAKFSRSIGNLISLEKLQFLLQFLDSYFSLHKVTVTATFYEGSLSGRKKTHLLPKGTLFNPEENKIDGNIYDGDGEKIALKIKNTAD